MGFWGLIQTLFNLIFLAALVYLWIRAHRPAKDDPRLSRGLQLLQNKISVIEDLSDRVEQQTEHFSAIVEQKLKELQQRIADSDQQVKAIEMSMRRSLDVAKIFQDKIPHEEIIERQNTIKYVKAAKLAHRGLAPEEIAKQVDLPMGEILFIAKVNRDQLQFEDSELPEWARDPAEVSAEPPKSTVTAAAHPTASAAAPVDTSLQRPSRLSELGERFRGAISSEPPAPAAAPTENSVQRFEFPQIK